MELSRVKQLPNLKLITSSESNCYIYKDIIYKIFKNNISIMDRLDIIKFFLENDIQNCPKLYDFIYDNNKIVGYSMRYYKKVIPFSEINRFKVLKEKSLELIDVYLSLKDNNNLCYIDFNKGNVFVNNSNILLLDIDSCLKRNLENEQISKQLLKDFILGAIYKTYFFDYETYFTSIEQEQIRSILCENIDSIDDLKNFINDVTKMKVRKVLKKIPYTI